MKMHLAILGLPSSSYIFWSRGWDTAMQPSTLRIKLALLRVVICSLRIKLNHSTTFRIQKFRRFVDTLKLVQKALLTQPWCINSIEAQHPLPEHNQEQALS